MRAAKPSPVFVATVLERTHERCLATIGRVDPRAGLIEVRLDGMEEPAPEALVAAVSRPLLLTCRSPRDGGFFGGSEAERLGVLKRGIAAGAAWIDVEARIADRIGDLGETRLVVSHHDFEATPEDLEGLLATLEGLGAEVKKLVTTARRPADVIRVLELLGRRSERGERIAAHVLGEGGTASRVLGARSGSAFVYGAARPGAVGAPGQPTLRSLLDEYVLERDLMSLQPLLLFGGDLDHSVSPGLMNRAFAAEGIPALYVPWAVGDAASVREICTSLEPAGAAVTIPLKERILDHLDALDPLAERIGAVNTIRPSAEGLKGWNTDLDGALDALREAAPDLAGRRALVVGAGGAARAIATGLAREGCRVAILGRTERRASRLARDVGGDVVRYEDLDPGGTDVIVNATPVGQWPEVEGMPVPEGLLRPGQVVLDAVYNPPETLLVAAARKAGCRVIPGIEMLARQGARQVAIWLGREISPGRLRDEGRARLLRRARTVLFIGPRGAGKTTVGRLVADLLGRPFRDLDEVIEARAGKSVSRIFTEDGEAVFRTLEFEMFREALGEPGSVLSVGAGLIETPGVREEIRRRGPRVVLLSAGAEVLAGRIRDSVRPSITGAPIDAEVEVLARRRDALYREVADQVADTSREGPEEIADEVVHGLGW